MSPALRAFALAALSVECLLSACSFSKAATGLAHAQESGAEILRRETTVAFSLCREEAVFTYFQSSLKRSESDPEATAIQTSFDNFWTRDSAYHDVHGTPISWASYCNDLYETGEIFNQAVLALGDYPRGIAALVDAKDFDGTSLNTIGTSIGTIATSLQAASAIVSAAQDVGSATSGMAAKVVSLIRAHELKGILKDSHQSVTHQLEHLESYLVALDHQLTLVAGSRDEVLGLVDTNRTDAGAFVPAAEGVLLFDVSTSSADRLQRIGAHIKVDRKLVSLIRQAEDTLADAAAGERTEPAQKAADELSNFVTTLVRTTRPEDP